ncbi:MULTISPECIES: hypothetical protein [Methylotuvimicrobium]|uniref:Lipoprotein n=2 Tax=Methylotuvimicrobium TaxID=2822410 RepID=G4T2D4_META2|nr:MULTISPECIES: hypothetical protein [Methylotuvimicrobium]QCW82792.1 hypothetical protein EQU24_11475 [Methylotuvimicrobium buryatense]CCE23574.1 conserved exported protein of unknown function [Methylotuvimicrobium alcaliphilum 20Z]
MKMKLLIGSAILATLAGCSTTQEKLAEDAPFVSDFPTQERVDYVLSCIAKKGGLTYITQYGCGCKIDKIAEKMSFADYDQARTFGFMRKTPGEAGGVFRDPPEAKRLRKLMEEAEAYAEKSCFVK